MHGGQFLAGAKTLVLRLDVEVKMEWWAGLNASSTVVRWFFCAGFVLCVLGQAQMVNADVELLDQSLEDLFDVEVTSVSKKPQKLASAAAAIYVISADDISRSGATTLPELLRSVPGLHVARIDANKWSVASRGFGGRFSNKLLVLIDGRNIYDPAFAGVYWETTDILLHDVERIEVIRGPGATLWGTNAVNGVINVISKSARDTLGFFASTASGSHQKQLLSLRMGGSLGPKVAARVYGKQNSQREFSYAGGEGAGDDYSLKSSGFQLDWRGTESDEVSISGDVYDADITQQIALVGPGGQPLNVDDEVDSSGWHIKGQWHRNLSLVSGVSGQTFYYQTDRDEALIRDRKEQFGLELQYYFAWQNQRFNVGGDYRKISDQFSDSSFATYILPSRRSYDISSIFIQDEISLLEERLKITLGTKVEVKEIGGTEVLPNLRFAWQVNENQLWWGAVSSSARTASRVESDDSSIAVGFVAQDDARLPPGIPALAIATQGGHGFEPEKLTAFELGWRYLPGKHWGVDATLYSNDYQHLRTAEIAPPEVIDNTLFMNLRFQNESDGHAEGLELSFDWRPNVSSYVKVSYSYFNLSIRRLDTTDVTADQPEKASPQNQVFAFAGYDLSDTFQLNVSFQYVDGVHPIGLSDDFIDAYSSVGFKLIWAAYKQCKVSLSVANLLDSKHIEFAQESFTAPTEIERSFLMSLDLAY